ncbi:MAG: diacylglycerol kinase family lipid kinase [Acidobacteriia bacterium]|nr:diacylglycerol kinase family lipid kinase [Terriglobia bacterium]
MSVLRTAAIVNPHSASGKTGKVWPGIAAQLGPVEVRFTNAAGHAIHLARQLLEEGFERLIAVGGDGTVNETVNGFFEQDRPVREGASLAIIPMGTGGDFQRSLGIVNVRDAIAVLRAGHTRRIDIGKVSYRSHQGEQCSRYFANLVSFGMGGEVAAAAKNWLSPVSGKAAFIWATLEVFFRYKAKTVELTIDGKPAERHTITNIAIGNGRFHGGGMHVCPKAKLDDGLLEVTIIDALGMWILARDLPVLYSENLYVHPKTHHYQARRVEARSAEKVSIEVDGEALGTLPLELSLLEGALPVVMKG